MYGKVDIKSWKQEAQLGELKFHRSLAKRLPNYPLEDLSAEAWQWTGLCDKDYVNRIVLDLGCGPIVKGLWFKGAYVVAVDPLANVYRNEVAWQRLDQASEVYSAGAEERIDKLINRVDLVVSRNALDHGYDFEKAVANIVTYMIPSAKAYLEFDIHTEIDDLHQMQMTPEYCEKVFKNNGLFVFKHEIDYKKRNLGDAHYYGLRKI